MPFIRGRYHINPVLGEALEAAREAENALTELEQEEQRSGPDTSRAKAPIHRVEIEAAELVPAHSGRAARGYVARVHRQASMTHASDASDDGCDSQQPSRNRFEAGASGNPSQAGPETHVFANHGDLLSFLGDELGNDAPQQ
jgi:hypothetical protein